MSSSANAVATVDGVRRRWLVRAGGLGCALALAACTSPEQPSSGTGSAQAAPTTLPPAPGADQADPAVDAELAPHQFSLDLGLVPDGDVHQYVEQIGHALQAATSPASLPCTCRVTNAHHLNAYAFPGGTIGITRGLLLALEDEAELAALLAHQLAHLALGHVQQALPRGETRKRLLATTVAASQESAWVPALGLSTPLGDSPLLAHFTVEQEVAADALAVRLIARAGYAPQALPGLLDRLAQQTGSQSALLVGLMARHPLDDGRRLAARQAAQQAAHQTNHPAPRPINGGGSPAARRRSEATRWAEQLAWLQRQREAVEACQLGELAMLERNPAQAQTHFEAAQAASPTDYASLVRLSQSLQAQGLTREAAPLADAARSQHPREAQAHRLAATLYLGLRDGAKAWLALEQYDRLLPGDPGVIFLQGVALESLGRTRHAAEHYRTYLRVTQEGQAAQYALSRVRALGYSP